MKSQSDLIYSYWAGVFDVRGCIRMRLTHGLILPYMTLKSRNKEWLKTIVPIFDGGVKPLRPSKDGTFGGGYYQWNRTGNGAQEVIQKIYPFLKNPIIIAQAKEIIDWIPRQRGKKHIVRGNVRVVNLMNLRHERDNSPDLY